MQFTPTNTIIFVEGLELLCKVGAGKEERSRRQLVIIDIECVKDDPAVETDKIRDAVDYAPIVEKVRALGENGEGRALIETLAYEIAAICFENKQIREVAVRVRKPRKFRDVTSVGISRRFKRMEE